MSPSNASFSVPPLARPPAVVAPLGSTDADAYHLVFQDSPQPMWVSDEETLAFLDVNSAALDVYGYSRDEFLRMDITQIRPPEEKPPLLNRLRSGKACPPRTGRHVSKDGRVIDVEVASKPLTLGGRSVRLTVIRDVSDHMEIEEQLRQAQKIESAGQLAGGIAHDFSNLLTAIIGHTELLSEYFEPTDPRAIEVDGIRSAAELAAGLTRQLLAFSREQILQPRVLDLNDVIDKTRRMIARLVGERVELVVDCGAGSPSVKADCTQIEQILLNLAVNARDAMPGGGRLTLRTHAVSADDATARRLGLPEVEYVVLSVGDTRLGIDAAVQTRLFEPSFTTKEHGHGTGLSLATVYGIVKQSGGHITVESEPARGTTFAIYLPATVEAAAGETVAAPGGGRETVLIVEDDAAVRGLIRDVLRRRGYRVLLVDRAAHALDLVSAHQGSIDLLIADVVLSGTTGPAVVEAIRLMKRDIKVLYVSGYTDGGMMPSGFMETSGVFLHKPFTPHALARKVRALLG